MSIRLYKIAFAKAHTVVFENIDDRLLFNTLGIVEATKSFSVKGCGIDTTHFQPLPNWFKKEQNALVFTFLGRFLYDKGIVEFVEAARIVKKKYPQILFWLVGEIDNENPSAIKNTLLHEWLVQGIIENKGFVDDVRPLIAASDCIVCPSYREAIPRVLQEGMAMAKPIITTDVAGCREAVEGGKNGFLVPVQSAEKLAQAMVQLIEMPETKRLEMGKNGQQKVIDEFDQNFIAADILKIIEKALQN
ncbi:MAG: glycosyltransferase family 4 protein [Saprospiraceae bacterium]|nr:glycosyltransferase family 4 protein [Saprospiraceae bacterium]